MRQIDSPFCRGGDVPASPYGGTANTSAGQLQTLVDFQGSLSTLEIPEPFILNPGPHNLHPTPYTLHPTPYTLHPTPYTLHPTPHTLHPTPYTLHPTPYALNSASRSTFQLRAGCIMVVGNSAQIPHDHA